MTYGGGLSPLAAPSFLGHSTDAEHPVFPMRLSTTNHIPPSPPDTPPFMLDAFEQHDHNVDLNDDYVRAGSRNHRGNDLDVTIGTESDVAFPSRPIISAADEEVELRPHLLEMGQKVGQERNFDIEDLLNMEEGYSAAKKHQ